VLVEVILVFRECINSHNALLRQWHICLWSIRQKLQC